MKASELFETKSTPSIVVDIQPAYLENGYGESNFGVFRNAAKFLKSQTGPILMFVNAEDQMMTDDSIQSIREFWDNDLGINYDESFWNRVTIDDKGYGYLRGWDGVDPAAIIKTIREMYAQRVTDSRNLFDGDEDEHYFEQMQQLIGDDFEDWMIGDNINVEWTSVEQLKRFNGAYIMGGGREECLKEVQLLMNAFNIRYKEISEFIY